MQQGVYGGNFSKLASKAPGLERRFLADKDEWNLPWAYMRAYPGRATFNATHPFSYL